MEDVKYCKCGCGKIVTSKTAKYIIGHNNRGKKLNLTEEQKERKRQTAKNNWNDPNIRATICQNIKKQKNTPEGRKSNAIAGKKGVEAIKEKLKNDPEFREKKRIDGKKGADILWSTKKDEMLEIRKNQWTDKARKNMSQSTIKKFEENPEYIIFLKNMGKERYSNPEERSKQSERITNAYLEGKYSKNKLYKHGKVELNNKKIYFQSSYEERFIYILNFFFTDNRFGRSNKKFSYYTADGILKFYLPDFVLDKKIYFEVKGYFSEDDQHKVKSVSLKSNFTIFMIFQEDLNLLENLIKQNINIFPFEKLSKFSKGKFYKQDEIED